MTKLSSGTGPPQAAMTNEDQFQGLIARRSELNDRLDETRSTIDEYLCQMPRLIPAKELAFLAGLLHVKRDLLDELAKVEDSMVDLLLALQSALSTPDDQTYQTSTG